MSAKSDYLEEKFIKHVLGIASYTSPTNTYVALFSSDPGEAAGGTEATGGSYARFTMAGSAWSTTGTDGERASNVDVQFTNMPAGTWTHFALLDASTSGNRLYHGALTTPKTTGVGDTARFLAGDLVIAET